MPAVFKSILPSWDKNEISLTIFKSYELSTVILYDPNTFKFEFSYIFSFFSPLIVTSLLPFPKYPTISS